MSLKQLRKNAGLTQTELAEQIGSTQVNVSNWETKRAQLPIKKLKALAHALGVAIEELLEDDFS